MSSRVLPSMSSRVLPSMSSRVLPSMSSRDPSMSLLTKGEIDSVVRDDPRSFLTRSESHFKWPAEYEEYKSQIWKLILKHHAVNIYSRNSINPDTWWMRHLVSDARKNNKYPEIKLYLDAVLINDIYFRMHGMVEYRYLLTKGYNFTKVETDKIMTHSQVCMLFSIGAPLSASGDISQPMQTHHSDWMYHLRVQLCPGWIIEGDEGHGVMMLYDDIRYDQYIDGDDSLIRLISDQALRPVLKRLIVDQRYDIIDRDRLFTMTIGGDYPETIRLLKSSGFTPSDGMISKVRELVQ